MRCKAIKSDGAKCKASAMHGSDFCFRHDKNVKEQAREASSDGGHARRLCNQLGTSVRVKTPKDIQRLMARAINSLWTGKMPSGNPAGSLGYLAKIFLEAYEKSELEERMELLEKRLDQIKP
jgi:hypothetical protein